MKLPTPHDPAQAPVWENYAVAQTVQASLGLVPDNTLAFGVAVEGPKLRLVFQLQRLDEQDQADMNEISDQLEALVGDEVTVEVTHEVRAVRAVDPDDGIRWVYLARMPGDYDP